MKNPGLILFAAVALIAAAPPPAPPMLANPSPDASATPAASAAPAASTAPSGALPSMGEIYGKPAPTASASPAPNNRARPTPPADDRKGLDGVWELAIQRVNTDVQYEHFNLKQTGNALAGTFLTSDKKLYPLAGSIDGTNVRMVVTLSDGSTILLEGRLDGTTDMLGMFTDSKERVPFTAAYRPKEKWMDNVNASPGGLGGGGIPPK